MKAACIWKVSLVVVIVISAIMLAPSLFKAYELSDGWIRILGAADIITLLVMVFSFVKSQTKR